MSKKLEQLTISQLNNLYTSGAGYDILRYISLPEMLGVESDTILYFMGKNLARKFKMASFEDLITIIDQLGWGKLEMVKEKKNELTFQLMADSVVLRLQAPFKTEFRLESGFLAEGVQQILGKECECKEEINKKIHVITFTVVITN
ncbi:YslB family protein [Oceanobacillus senegalensis]|uniref:YslB family protein n=1 Tax=Oceanobacillus senegalensis TaxID=1936063 RepID=UPI000A30F042|nr:YslB family protein [Oceanobacillus senegalensis]